MVDKNTQEQDRAKHLRRLKTLRALAATGVY